MEEGNKRIVKNTIYLYTRSLLMMGISLFSSRVVLQVLGVSDYGLYGVIGSVVAMFVIVNGVLSAGTSRFLTYELGVGDKERLAKTFSASFILHVCLAIILFAALETIGLWFLNTQMMIPEGRLFAANVVYQLSILECMLSLTQVPYGALFIAHERMDVIAYVGILEVFFKLCLILLLLYGSFSDNLIAYAIILATWSIGLQLWYRFFCVRHFKESRLRLVKDRQIYKGMLSYSLWDFIGQFCATGNTQGVNILINVFFGVVFNASRAIAYQVESALTQFVSNFMTAVQPQIVKAYAQKNYFRFFSLIFDSGRYSYYLLFALTLPVFIEADFILSLWLVEVPILSSLFLRWVMIISLIGVIDRPVINGVHATGDVKVLNLTSGVYAAGTFLPIVYLLFYIGFPVWSCFVVQLINSFVCMWFRVRALSLKIPFKKIVFFRKVVIHPICVSLVASVFPVIVYYVFEQGFLRLVITFVLSLCSTFLCVYFWGVDANMRNKILLYFSQRFLGINKTTTNDNRDTNSANKQ